MGINERLGAFVGYVRKKQFQETQLKALKQEEFIKATRFITLYECPAGENVCTRATLHKLENGQKIQEFQLIPFFLKKLGFQQQIKDDSLNRVDQILNHYLLIHQLENIDEWYSNFLKEVENKNHQLLDFDCNALNCYQTWLKSDKKLSIEIVFNLIDCLNILNQLLKNSIVELIIYEIYNYPNNWKYAVQVLNRFHYLRIENELTHWFEYVFKNSPTSLKIKFPDKLSSKRFITLKERYQFYSNHPRLTVDNFNQIRKEYLMNVSRKNNYLKYEPFPFILTLSLIEIQSSFTQ